MRTRKKFNHFWTFTKQPLDSTYEGVISNDELFEPVTLPHDWLIYNTDKLYEDSMGWYRKILDLEEVSDNVALRFEGVYMDCTVYVNGQMVGEWKYGYTTFELEISDYLHEGGNLIVVQVHHQSPNSRWYSGAGIYRDVWLLESGSDFLLSDGIYVTTEKQLDQWVMKTETMLCGQGEMTLTQRLYYENMLVTETSETVKVESGQHSVAMELMPESVYLWSPKEPNLYRLETLLEKDGVTVSRECQKVGFKEVVMNSAEGFFLNGQRMKLNGVCEHHDLGCLGAAFNKEAMRYRLTKLKAMGVNAIRTAHNMPAPGLMELADEMGFMIVSEAFDMWELSKTTYDYARFFKEWAPRDVRQWVCRDRNHVSLIMWSIGNEIYDTHSSERGAEVTVWLTELVKQWDPKGNGLVTIGSNFMPWEKAQKCADLVKIAGYNYGEKYYEPHHDKYEDWCIYGSETASIVQSRGVYHFPLNAAILADDDLQCSALGNSSTSWGAKSLETCIGYDMSQTYSMGQFLWTGFDYIGEPTPYHTRNAYFGQIDTAGFEKDSYHVYRHAWNNDAEPSIHIFPYWNFNEGQMIDVRVTSNQPYVKLYLNDELIGEKALVFENGLYPIADFRVPYSAGVLKAIGYDQDHKIMTSAARHSFGDAVAMKVKAHKAQMAADGEDLVIIEVQAIDKKGNPVENANDRVQVSVTENGRILGMDNGNSTDTDPYKTHAKRLFSGKCQCIIGSTYSSGDVSITLDSKTLGSAKLTVEAIPTKLYGEAEMAQLQLQKDGPIDQNAVEISSVKDEQTLIRSIELIADMDVLTRGDLGLILDQDTKESLVKVRIHPEDADDQTLTWRLVNSQGIDVDYAAFEVTEDGCRLTALSDGAFRLRCIASNGKEHADIMSELEFEVCGMGIGYKNPYSFISAGLYDFSQGEVGSGNERGIATSRDGRTVVGYHDLDFGEYGADTITMPIFELESTPLVIEMWEGVPGEEGSAHLGDYTYDKPTKWNTYQAETFILPRRLEGKTSLAFASDRKFHLKGFRFAQKVKAYEKLFVSECDALYGDTFEKKSWGIQGIGNNVTVVFDSMDFDAVTGEVQDKAIKSTDKKSLQLQICGKSNTEKNTIVIQVTTDKTTIKTMVEFERTEEVTIKDFELPFIEGTGTVEFIFLPGSDFDFRWIQFNK